MSMGLKRECGSQAGSLHVPPSESPYTCMKPCVEKSFRSFVSEFVIEERDADELEPTIDPPVDDDFGR